MDGNKFTIENAKKAAIGFANDSLERGCLYIAMPEEGKHDDSLGDAETLETLASLVVNDGIDSFEYEEAKDIVLTHLEELFPEFR